MKIVANLKSFAASLAGRLVLILTIGIAAASISSLLLAERARVHDFQRFREERVVASAVDMAHRFAQQPVQTGDLLRRGQILGAREAPVQWRSITPDRDLERMLEAQLGDRSQPKAAAIPNRECFPNFNLAIQAAGMNEEPLPDCWYVEFRDGGGTIRHLSIDLAPFRIPPNPMLDPLYLGLILVTSMVLSLIVARAATAPLRRLTQAARTFSVTVDPEPIEENGPAEVKSALATFNLMQHRVRDGFRERTQILASITHDLQTPLTRLRLRLEQVEDQTLRERLIIDLAVTQKLVRDGLELARSSESRERWSIVDIDSILSSIAEDRCEMGQRVQLISTSGLRARAKPDALMRCVGNLVDNAVRYAGEAEISSEATAGHITISVRDHGPGIPEPMLEQIFEPFQRIDPQSSHRATGSGLGLSIARAQAKTFGAVVTLRNYSTGGLLATIRWPLHNRSADANTAEIQREPKKLGGVSHAEVNVGLRRERHF